MKKNSQFIMKGIKIPARWRRENSQNGKRIIMDTKLVKEFGTEILSYRIRTARQKKRMLHEDLDKHLLRMHKEEMGLYKKKRNLGWEPLDPPVQIGWKRYYVLRSDIARSRQAAFFDSILSKINTCQWSHKRDFKIKRKKNGRKTYVVKEQKLLEPEPYHFSKLDFSDEEKEFFHIEYRIGKWSRVPVLRYVFNEPWRFVLRIRPNIVGRVKTRDDALESRIAEIKNFLRVNDYSKRQARLKSGHWQQKHWKEENEQKFNERRFFEKKSLGRNLFQLDSTRESHSET